jgi:6-phosphogluconolactonase
MNRMIEVLPDNTRLIQRSLDLILEKLHLAILDRGKFSIALSGGNTPKPLYQALAQQDLPWDKILVLWGDERYVPADHPDSNAGMARTAWLNHVPIPAENIYPMPTDEADPAMAAQRYEQTLQQLFQTPPGTVPAIDVILLGIGDDGHTASLFPHTDALQVRDRLVTVGNKDGQPRITFTVPLINQGRCDIFVVEGGKKQAALSQIFADAADAMTYPARLIQPEGELWWLLDQAAGEHLDLAALNHQM